MSAIATLSADSFGVTLKIHRQVPECPRDQPAFFAPDFALKAPLPWYCGELGEAELKRCPLPAVLHQTLPCSTPFTHLHQEILTHIGAGTFAKVVPIVWEELQFASPLQLEHFARVISEYKQYQFIYALEYQGDGMCGVTPELLFEVQDGSLRTMALAGTGQVGDPPLLQDAKERYEHEIVIDHMISELKPWGEIEVGETIERAYGSLKHLYTPIQVRLNRPPDFTQLVATLHPTAALGGWPRQAAREWLERQDFHRGRGRFGAPFGFVNGDHMLCVVAIRGLQWWGSRAQLTAGCGVVQGSRMAKEWQELERKRQATRQVLGIPV